jgi:hypothetical protein
MTPQTRRLALLDSNNLSTSLHKRLDEQISTRKIDAQTQAGSQRPRFPSCWRSYPVTSKTAFKRSRSTTAILHSGSEDYIPATLMKEARPHPRHKPCLPKKTAATFRSCPRNDCRDWAGSSLALCQNCARPKLDHQAPISNLLEPLSSLSAASPFCLSVRNDSFFRGNEGCPCLIKGRPPSHTSSPKSSTSF